MAQKTINGKLIIDFVITLESGMHIGGSNDYAPIGAVDSVFVRDPLTRRPVITGSSFKGKLRTLLAKSRDGAGVLPDPSNDEKVVARLFGRSTSDESCPSRLLFADSFPTEDSLKRFEGIETGTYLGEVKFENTIKRGSGVANPRQIERVPAGMQFACRIIYNIEDESELEEDMTVLADGLRLMQLDYIGGHGSRGYGRVSFSGFDINSVSAADGSITHKDELSRKFDGLEIRLGASV